MTDAANSAAGALRGSLLRLGGFFAFWLVLAGFNAADLPAGALAAIIATGASLRLLPPGRRSLRPIMLLRFAVRFLRQSVVAGLDVAWRALDPRLPLRPGFVIYQSRLPPGPMRNAFCTIASLLPGTLPSAPDESGALVIHCLDLTQPVTEQLAADEALLIDVFGGTRHNA